MGGVNCKEECEKYKSNIEERGMGCSVPWFSDIEVDWNGCRKFPRLPPPGQHPRLFFTAEEIPDILARFTHCGLSGQLTIILDATRKSFLQETDGPLSMLGRKANEDPLDREIVDMFFKPNEHRYVNILGSYVYGVVFDDSELAEKAKSAALFQARVILRSREIALQDDQNGVLVHGDYFVWLIDKWELKTGWLLGGAPFALMYDLVYNELSRSEQDLFRNAITTSVRGRRSWGMGWPGRRIQSNWAAYNGDLLTMCAVTEDEEGFDQTVYSMFSDLMVHYLEYAFYDSGHPVEDCYAINLGLREGSICFVAMARRGHNIFNNPCYKRIWTKWFPYALEPQSSGRVYGGSSGNSFIYPTSLIIAKYMFPKDKTIDFIYRLYMTENGKHLSRILKLQSRLAALTFAIPALPEHCEKGELPQELDLPLNFVCRDRGKVVMRSSWKEDAMWFTFDARPDCFLIGHDTCSRGAFVLSAHGRTWGFCPEWKSFKDSSDYSLPSIDNVGQHDKAPFVKLQEVQKGSCNSTFVSADLTYAYNWMWTTWADEWSDHKNRGYELEPHDPRDFGFRAWWAPNKLHGERNVAFVGLHQWRKRFAMVQKVFRSSLFVPSVHPFVIIQDDLQKDENVHTYAWAMTTPDDVKLSSYANGDAILSETEGTGRRFLVRNLLHTDLDLECSFRQIATLRESSNRDDKPRQLVFTCRSVCVRFCFLLCSLPNSWSEVPATKWHDGGKRLCVSCDDMNDMHQVTFETHEKKPCSLTLQ